MVPYTSKLFLNYLRLKPNGHTSFEFRTRNYKFNKVIVELFFQFLNLKGNTDY